MEAEKIKSIEDKIVVDKEKEIGLEKAEEKEEKIEELKK